jgi:hypothetical protein
METLSTPLEALMERLRGQSSRPVGPQPSMSERELLELLESHADHETEALHAYEELAGGSPDEHVRYVAGLLLADERDQIASHRAVSVIVFLIDFVVGMRSPKTVPDDPWEASTLEWYTTSPPLVHNVDLVPEVPSARSLCDLRRAQRAAATE